MTGPVFYMTIAKCSQLRKKEAERINPDDAEVRWSSHELNGALYES